MAHSKARATDGKVTYPPGVKEISDKISKEEMVRRLKVSVFLLTQLQPVNIDHSIPRWIGSGILQLLLAVVISNQTGSCLALLMEHFTKQYIVLTQLKHY